MIKILFFVVWSLIFISCASNNQHSSDTLVNALLNEDWVKAQELCEKDYKDSSSTIYRAIKGHVFLANNKNNESLELFLSIREIEDKDVWLKWTKQFLQEYKNNPVALFLYGDGLARKNDFENASRNYQIAENEAKQNLTKAMILNALGVAYASMDSLNKAINILEKANIAFPELADPYASLGSVFLWKNAAGGALEYFNKALTKSKDFLLAINGRGCSNFLKFDKESFKLAVSDFSLLLKDSNNVIKDLATMNINLIGNEVLGKNFVLTDSIGMHTRTNSQIRKDIVHNVSLIEAIDYFNPAGMFDQLKNKTQSNLNKQYDVLKSRGVNFQSPDKLLGGATTSPLIFAQIDKGNYKLYSWYGLVQKKN